MWYIGRTLATERKRCLPPMAICHSAREYRKLNYLASTHRLLPGTLAMFSRRENLSKRQLVPKWNKFEKKDSGLYLATSVLKQYMPKGYVVNRNAVSEQKYEDLKRAMGLLENVFNKESLLSSGQVKDLSRSQEVGNRCSIAWD